MNTKIICILFLMQNSFANQFNAPVTLEEGAELIIRTKLTNNSNLILSESSKFDIYGEYTGVGTIKPSGVIKIDRNNKKDTEVIVSGNLTNQIIVNSELTLKMENNKILIFGKFE